MTSLSLNASMLAGPALLAVGEALPLAILTLLSIFGINLLFLALCMVPVVLMGFYAPAAFAVLKRNFIGYFSNPTGYVFLVLFVLMTSFAAFWPPAFFTNNLANLDLLNRFMPLIMLIFIPAITMSTWAEERRQGTDELLLTLPATDFDIVIGKYTAAAAIFTVSLLFSQLSHGSVLVSLTEGDLDVRLLATTYLGYWLMGLAMLSIGMVASFFTSNLTIGFVLGGVLNAPLAFASVADVIITNRWLAGNIRYWSLGGQFEPFGRGLVTLSSLSYFVMIIVIGLYLCMVLIGRRHWLGGRDGASMLGHYLLRIVALGVFSVGLSILLVTVTFLNPRVDMTENQISTLSPDSIRLLRELDKKTDHPIQIEAYVSADVPPDYIKTRYDLINNLKEFQAIAGSRRIELRLHDNLEPFSEEARQAEKKFNITPQRVRTESRGSIKEEEVLLGAAFTCGLERVVVPFFDYGMPVEYELVRSVATVADQKRKKLGILRTDANLNGGQQFSMSGVVNIPKQAIVEELEKQYDVEMIEPGSPLDVWVDDDGKQRLKYDVLLVVQPSSLDPPGLDNLLAAIRQGQPTAIFEDPAPMFFRSTPGTSEPKQNPMAMFSGGPPPQKGDITRLWSLLGIEALGETGGGGFGGPGGTFQADIVWQLYNPYRKYEHSAFPPEYVIVRPELEAEQGPFNQKNPITSGLEEVLFPFPGAIADRRESDFEFEPLVTTGSRNAGTVKLSDLQTLDSQSVELQYKRKLKGDLVLAAAIHGKLPKAEDAETTDVALKDEKAKDEKSEGKDGKSGKDEDEQDELNVIYVSDIDVLSTPFVNVRARPDAGEGVKYRFDNITFVLNTLDQLAGEHDFINIRKRKTKYSTLKVIEMADERARDEEYRERQKFNEEFDKAKKAAEEQRDKATAELRKVVEEFKTRIDAGDENVDLDEYQKKVLAEKIRQEVEKQKFENEVKRLERERDAQIADIHNKLDMQVLGIQYKFKFWAVMLPWILPALVGLVVFVRRRLREREGITKARRK